MSLEREYHKNRATDLVRYEGEGIFRVFVRRDNVLYTANWRRDGEFVATWTNRVQNKAEIVVYDTKGNANNIYYEEETEGWLRIQPPLYHNQYVIIVKLQDSGTKAGRFLHATRFEYKNGVLRGETDLTPGTREVVSLLLVDHARSTLYYLGTELDKPSHKNLYSVQLAGDEPPICLSCQLLTPEGKRLISVPTMSKNYFCPP